MTAKSQSDGSLDANSHWFAQRCRQFSALASLKGTREACWYVPPRLAPLNNSASCVFAAALCLYFHFVTNYFGREQSPSGLLRFQATSQVEEKRLGPGQKTVRLQVGLCVFKKKKKKKTKIASVLVSSLLFLFGFYRCDCVCDGVFRKGIRPSGRRKHTNRHKHRMMQHLSWWWQICCVYVFVIGGKKKSMSVCLTVSFPSSSCILHMETLIRIKLIDGPIKANGSLSKRSNGSFHFTNLYLVPSSDLQTASKPVSGASGELARGL